jgi:class 3 adenylate cyclase/alpha-beta hydrolase superfamily lysophospholipase
MQPETRYAKSGDVHIAYQVVGDGPIDLVVVAGFVTHLEDLWEDPRFAGFLQRLASFSRLILFDKRGTGMSDRVPDAALPTLEQRMDDVRAVMDAAGSERAALLGWSEGGPMSVLFAATYPQRTVALILYGSYARRLWAQDYPWGPTAEERQRYHEALETRWGSTELVKYFAPTIARDEHQSRRFASEMRRAASPGAALALARMAAEIDIRDVLPTVNVPTLVLHRTGDPSCPVEGGRYLAERIPGARLTELPGDDHPPGVGDTDSVVFGIEEFLTGSHQVVEPDRVLATVLFTDIVGSTERAAAIGDQQWRALLGEHHTTVRRELGRFRGREIHTAGDGFLATFDGPARAARCAVAITRAVRPLGLEVRAGVHTGEVEVMDDDIGGIAVHIGARVAAVASPGEVLVSSTVRDLVAGSGLDFEDRGAHSLKGVPGEWRLFRVVS